MKTSAPLSKVQYGLYVECVAHQGEACYNLPYLYVLDGTLEEERLLKAIETAVAAHPTLITRIELDEQEEFQQAMDEAGQDPKKAKQMAALLAYKDMAHGQKTFDVQRDNDYTTQVLYRLGFSWSPTSWDYVERMLTAIGGFGFFE